MWPKLPFAIISAIVRFSREIVERLPSLHHAIC
jgi:hypothetical protein